MRYPAITKADAKKTTPLYSWTVGGAHSVTRALIVGLEPIAAAYAQTRSPNGFASVAASVTPHTAMSVRAVPGESLRSSSQARNEQERREHEAAVHVHPDEHEDRDDPQGSGMGAASRQDPQRHREQEDADQLRAHREVLAGHPEAGDAQERCRARRRRPGDGTPGR